MNRAHFHPGHHPSRKRLG